MSKWVQANSTNKKLDQNSRKKKRERERDEKCTCAFPHVIRRYIYRERGALKFWM